MTVIANTILTARRIVELQRRRRELVERQERLRRTLPEWAFAPLRLVGMSAEEIRRMMEELDRAEAEAGLDVVEAEIEALDQQIDTLEQQLLGSSQLSFEGVVALLDLAVARLRESVATDPEDVFYDHGDARTLFLLERALEDLRALLRQDQRAAS